MLNRILYSYFISSILDLIFIGYYLVHRAGVDRESYGFKVPRRYILKR